MQDAVGERSRDIVRIFGFQVRVAVDVVVVVVEREVELLQGPP